MLEQLQNIGDTISHTGELIVAKVFQPHFKINNEAYTLNSDRSMHREHYLLNREEHILSCSMLAWYDGELVLIEAQKSHVNSKVYSKLRKQYPTTFKHYLDFDFIQCIDFADDTQLDEVLGDWAMDAMFQSFTRGDKSKFLDFLSGNRVVFDTWDSFLHTNKGSITLESYQRPGKKSIPKIVCRDTHMRVVGDLPSIAINQALQEFELEGASCSNLGISHQQFRNSQIKYHIQLLNQREYDEVKLSAAMERRCKRMAEQLEEEKQAKQQAEAEGRVYEQPKYNSSAHVQQRIKELSADSVRQQQHTQHSSGDEAFQNAPELPQNQTQD